MIFFIQIKAVNLAEKGLFTNLQLFSTVVFFRCSIKAYLSYFPIFRWSYIFLDEEWSSLILCIFCGFPFWLFYPLFSFLQNMGFLRIPLGFILILGYVRASQGPPQGPPKGPPQGPLQDPPQGPPQGFQGCRLGPLGFHMISFLV